jgi:pimeloyl-ACP methyl ester carboxylesterase
MPQTDTAVFSMLYFQTPGAAEAEYERDVRDTMRRVLYSASGDAPPRDPTAARTVGMVPRQGGLLSQRTNPTALPAWLTEADIDYYTAEFSRTGFRGGLNWYRNIDRNWELLGAYTGARVNVPALYVAGDRDLVVAAAGGPDQLTTNLRTLVPKLRNTIMLPGCGHWTQQERPKEVNAAIVDFLRAL